MLTAKRVQLTFVAVVGFVAARAYYRWLLHSGTNEAALRSFDSPAYWSLLAVPAVAVFVPFCLLALRQRTYAASWVIGGAVVAAIAIAFLGLFGDFLVCVFITHGVCE
jgi:hypothetical protein